MKIQPIERELLCKKCNDYKICKAKKSIIVCSRWIEFMSDIEYASARQKKDRLDGRLLKPIALTNEGFIYYCASCGCIFSYDRMIHIPMCEQCREVYIDKLAEHLIKPE
jgi:hypothetical protein